MNRFIKNLVKFFFVAVAVYLVCLLGTKLFLPGLLSKNLKYSEAEEGYLYTRLRDADTTKNIDVLFLGSSHAYRGYDVRKFQKAGYSAFNLGSSAQTPLQTEVLVTKYLDQFKPKFVFLDVYPILLGNDGVESTLDLIANDSFNRHTFLLALKTKNVMVYNSLVYDIFHDMAGIEIVEKPISKSGDKYIPGGYIESSIMSKKRSADLEVKTYSVSSKQSKAIRNILTKLKKRHIPYVFIQAPIRADKYRAVTNNRALDSIISTYGPYFNFNKISSFPDSLFMDPSHLNQAGVNKFNVFVLQILKKNFRKNKKM